MIKHFITTFSFEDDIPSIGKVLQVIKRKVFEEITLPEEEQPEWDVHMQYALACYNLAMDDGDGEDNEETKDEDSRNIDIPETEGEHEVQGPKLHSLMWQSP